MVHLEIADERLVAQRPRSFRSVSMIGLFHRALGIANARQPGLQDQPWGKFFLIGTICAAQALPLSFSNAIVPTAARSYGLQPSQFWLLSLPLVPMWAKLLWAPMVDSYGSRRFGRRRSWILPCTAAAAALLAMLGLLRPAGDLLIPMFLLLTLQMSIVATQDIAVDGYTIENLDEHERALGAGVKAIFEAVGALLSGTFLFFMLASAGWTATTLTAAILFLLLTLPIVLRKESMPSPRTKTADRASLARFMRQPFMLRRSLLLIGGGATNASLSAMLGPFLLDRGLSLGQAGMIVGTIYLIGELCGSAVAALFIKRVGSIIVLYVIAGLAPFLIAGLAITARSAEVDFVSAALLGFLPAILISTLHAVFTFERLSWAVGAQPGTDFTGYGAFYNIGRTIAPALAGLIVAASGWSAFFFAMAALLIGVCLSMAKMIDGTRARQPQRATS
ncbi:hypothetical protein CLG96_07725 [Sphingomonas oleivorans]|uniref:MFS transporter n=1 Tax=Sphingomonas oleivorans TaxID=1735121 RepID=A0A2T5FYX3_9SPHN|nr:MFS transporter [Sphingomonas oleivorans]PTQ11807.1 hypothetical protein CLG96_07725 [Sphingomonas oleivorans]